MKLIRLAGITFSLSLALLLTGCGDTFRPVVTPFPTPGGDPQAARTAFVLSHGNPQPNTTTCTDGTTTPCTGASTEIDVPGDTNMGNRVQGREPWHAQIGTSAVALYVANRDSNTVTYYAPFLGSSSAITTISLPGPTPDNPGEPQARPVFVHSTESASIYVAESGRNKVAVISAGASQFSQEIAVGTTPVALAETPDKTRLYVVNKGSGTVTVVATLDKTVLGTIPVGSKPVWAIATPDSKFVFVLNRGSNTISLLSTSNNQKELAHFAVGASADVDMPLDNPMYYDSKAQRLYVVNSTSNTLSVFDTSALATNAPTITEVKPQSPIALPAGSGPVSVAALSDGSKVYTGNMGDGSVSIIDARNLALKTTLSVKPTSSSDAVVRVVALAASPDASKVYAAVPDTVTADGKVIQPPGTSIIAAANDTILQNNGTPITIPAPFQDPVSCVSDNPLTWTASTAFVLNAVVTPTAGNGHFYRATTAGTSGTAEPAWCTDTSGCTVNDGTVVWTEIGASAPACPRESPMWVLTSTP
jgi:YVTN family beta-propeller protein